jgi:hypothetical protein
MKQPPTPSTDNMCKEIPDRVEIYLEELVASEDRSLDEEPSENSQEKRLSRNTQEQRLLVSQEIGPFDVLCGRRKDAFNNIGNRRFRVTVSLWLSRYFHAPTRHDKSLIIYAISALVRETGGRFLKHRKGALLELSDKEIREKVGHALRDMVAATNMALASSKDDVSLDIGNVVPGAARREEFVRSRSGHERKITLGAGARKSYRTTSSGHNEQHHAKEWNAPLCIPESGIEMHGRLSTISSSEATDFEINQVFALSETPDSSTSGNTDEGESSIASSAVGMLDSTEEDDDGQMDRCWEDIVAPTDINDLFKSFGSHSVCQGGVMVSTEHYDIWIDWDLNDMLDDQSTALDRIPSIDRDWH